MVLVPVPVLVLVLEPIVLVLVRVLVLVLVLGASCPALASQYSARTQAASTSHTSRWCSESTVPSGQRVRTRQARCAAACQGGKTSRQGGVCRAVGADTTETPQ